MSPNATETKVPSPILLVIYINYLSEKAAFIILRLMTKFFPLG